MRTIGIHRFESEREAYDVAQTDEVINDGDVMVAGTVVGVLVQAWPTYVAGTEPREFHRLVSHETWETLEGGKYVEAVKVARALVPVEPVGPMFGPVKCGCSWPVIKHLGLCDEACGCKACEIAPPENPPAKKRLTWVKVSRAGELTARCQPEPGKGVWVTSEEVGGDEGQVTIERIALNGVVQHSARCYHGQGRMAMWRLAQGLAKTVKFAKNVA